MFGLLAPAGLRLGPSHVAIACQHGKSVLWVESTMLCPRPCLIRDKFVKGCQAHDPQHRIDDYLKAGGRVDLYRLSPIDQLSQADRVLLSTILIDHHVDMRVDYDLLDALFSGTLIGRRLAHLFGTHKRAFCSELIAKVLMRVGRMNRGNPNKYSPARLLRRLVRDGTYRFERSEQLDQP